MWQKINETRMFKSINGPVLIQIPGVKRKDGFTITHEVQEDPEFGNIEVFLCKGSFGKFKFAASRFKSGRPVDVYEVLVSADLTSNEEMCRMYSKDIESALLNFPTDVNYNNTQVKEVLFNIKGSYAHAGDI